MFFCEKLIKLSCWNGYTYLSSKSNKPTIKKHKLGMVAYCCPKNGKSGSHSWGREGSTQFAQQLVSAPPLVGCVVWSQLDDIIKAERQECPPLNPCWDGFKCPLEIRKGTICLRITLSNTLIITDVREIGRSDNCSILKIWINHTRIKGLFKQDQEGLC